MQFPYQNFHTTNELGLRWYHTPVGALPSITTVLSVSESDEKKESLNAWRNSIGAERAAVVSKEATDHGTMVHLLAERFLKKEEVFAPVGGVEISEKDRDGFNGLKLKLRQINEVWGQEESIYSPTLEIAGRFDCVGLYKSVPSIIDFKTASRVKSFAEVQDYALQLSFYAVAHNELFGTNIEQGVVLMSSGGMPQEFAFNVEEHLEELIRRTQVFWEKTLSSAGLDK